MVKEFVSYDVDADKAFRRVLKKAAKSGLDLSFSMGEAARIIKKSSTKNFILKGFGRYAPLSPAYFLRKKILAPGTPILTGVKPGKLKRGKTKKGTTRKRSSKISGGGASGKLKRSIIGNTADSIVRIGERSLAVGTKALSSKGAPYPGYVQDGTAKMPARKFLFFSNRMVREIINTINADIKNQL